MNTLTSAARARLRVNAFSGRVNLAISNAEQLVGVMVDARGIPLARAGERRADALDRVRLGEPEHNGFRARVLASERANAGAVEREQPWCAQRPRWSSRS